MALVNLLTTFASTGGSEESAGIAALGIDPWAIVAQAVTFLILLYLLKKFALDKVVKVLEDRRTAIDTSLDKAEDLHKQNDEAQAKLTTLLKGARKEADEIIQKSHVEAGSIVQAAETSAQDKATKIIADGELRIQAEVEKARTSLKKETLELVAQATSILLEETLDAGKNEQLIEKALKASKS